MSDGKPFVPAWLDDAGLSVLAFRIYCRILRRGNFYESKTKLEREFGVGNRAMAAAFTELTRRGFVIETPLVGKPSSYRPSANQHYPLVPDSTTPCTDPVPTNTTPQCQIAPLPSAIQHHHLVLDSTTKETPIKETPKKETPVKETEPLALPFDSVEFAEVWNDWEQHRRERKKPITPTARKAQLRKCQEWGEHRAIAYVRNATMKGWEGLYPDKDYQPPTGRATFDEVVGFAKSGGRLEAEAKIFFDECESAGWTDFSGKPIQDWQANFRAFCERREERASRAERRDNPQPKFKGIQEDIDLPL